MKKKLILPGIVIIFSVFLVSCSASTSGRYGANENKTGKKEEKKEENTEKTKKEYEENFDLTPYHATIDVKTRTKKPVNEKDLDIWYNYQTKTETDTSAPQIVNQVEGYRVQVFSTDNLEEADSIRTQLYSQTNQKAVYITFEPPFYKVKVGDFQNISEAKDLAFKLNQIGYSEARVINEKVNIFKK